MIILSILVFRRNYPHGGGESYAVCDICIIADFGKLFRGSLAYIEHRTVIIQALIEKFLMTPIRIQRLDTQHYHRR